MPRSINRGTGVLAMISTAPFIGLFGTVWGIMNSFIGISKAQTTKLAVVAPGIAEALLATAMGLFAAIPAVIIYNRFVRSTAEYRGPVADACAEVSGHVSRDLDRAEARAAMPEGAGRDDRQQRSCRPTPSTLLAHQISVRGSLLGWVMLCYNIHYEVER